MAAGEEIIPMKNLTIHFPWPWSGEQTRHLLRFTFFVSVVTLVALVISEHLDSGFVSSYLNIDDVVVGVMGLGILTALWPVPTTSSIFSWRALAATVIVAAVLLLWMRHELTFLFTLKQPITILMGCLVALIGMAVWFEHDE